MLRINASKNKICVFEREILSHCNTSLNCEELEVADDFMYFGVKFSEVGTERTKKEL